jgi:hypothetical protein
VHCEHESNQNREEKAPRRKNAHRYWRVWKSARTLSISVYNEAAVKSHNQQLHTTEIVKTVWRSAMAESRRGVQVTAAILDQSENKPNTKAGAGFHFLVSQTERQRAQSGFLSFAISGGNVLSIPHHHNRRATNDHGSA